MLDGVEKTKLGHAMYTTPNQTHPHPIKKHLEKFSEQELVPLKREVGDKLIKMHYAKQLEDMFSLYDIYEPATLPETSQSATGLFLAAISISAYIKFKKGNLLNFSSYVNNIYGIAYIGLLSFTFAKWAQSGKNIRTYSNYTSDYLIQQAKSQIHSNNINIVSNLRF